GDMICSPGEVGLCPYDCGSCGDGVCGAFEDVYSCAKDCGGYCGDFVCSLGETCAYDCGFCGDGICGAGENPTWCPGDCGGAQAKACQSGVDVGTGDSWVVCAADED